MAKRVLKEKIVVKIEKTNTGFSAFTLKYPVFTTGASISEIRLNLIDALNLYFEDAGIKVFERNIHLVEQPNATDN